MCYHGWGFPVDLILLNVKPECLYKSFRQCLSYDDVADVHNWTSQFVLQVAVLSSIQPIDKRQHSSTT